METKTLSRRQSSSGSKNINNEEKTGFKYFYKNLEFCFSFN